jgi:MOSC domain-containing protein YiiM
MGAAVVLAVCRDDQHRFSKRPASSVLLVAGVGVDGDAHAGTTVQHRSRVAVDPSRPNLRQVHLLPVEFHDEAREHGYVLGPGDLGENVLTSGLDLLELPRGTLLRLGTEAVVRVTGLRNPCRQIDAFRPGLLRLAVRRDDNGQVLRRAGVMSVVVAGGTVAPGAPIDVVVPPPPYQPLAPV